MVKIEEKDIVPVCPHCKKEMETVVTVKRKFTSLIHMFCCPHCKALLGMCEI